VEKQYSESLNLYQYAILNPILNMDAAGLAVGYPNPGCGTCGPDVTTALNQVVHKIKNDYNSWDKKKRNKKCSWVFNPAKLQYSWSWDIYELHSPAVMTQLPGGNTCPLGDQSCKDTVTISGKCYKSHAVNYIQFGVMGKLCGYELSYLEDLSMGWKKRKYKKSGNPWDYSGQDTEWHGWMRIGYSGNSADLFIQYPQTVTDSIHTHCTPCTTCVAPRLQYTWQPIYPGDENPANYGENSNPR
jgi:hypothetical protein